MLISDEFAFLNHQISLVCYLTYTGFRVTGSNICVCCAAVLSRALYYINDKL
jgi:hypothetical protein